MATRATGRRAVGRRGARTPYSLRGTSIPRHDQTVTPSPRAHARAVGTLPPNAVECQPPHGIRMSPSASGKSWPFTSMTVALSVAVSAAAALTKIGETFSTMAKATQSNANHRGSGSDVRSSWFSTPRHALDTFVAPRGPPSSQLRQAAAAVDHHVNDRVFRCRGGSGGVQRLPGLPPRSGLRVSAESNA